MWSKRFFVITDEKIVYYTDSDRLDKKGEIVLVGSTAKVSATRGSSKRAHYFTVNNTECGIRELYAKSKVRRQQWIDKIIEVQYNEKGEVSPIINYSKVLTQADLPGQKLDFGDEPEKEIHFEPDFEIPLPELPDEDDDK